MGGVNWKYVVILASVLLAWGAVGWALITLYLPFTGWPGRKMGGEADGVPVIQADAVRRLFMPWLEPAMAIVWILCLADGIFTVLKAGDLRNMAASARAALFGVGGLHVPAGALLLLASGIICLLGGLGRVPARKKLPERRYYLPLFVFLVGFGACAVYPDVIMRSEGHLPLRQLYLLVEYVCGLALAVPTAGFIVLGIVRSYWQHSSSRQKTT